MKIIKPEYPLKESTPTNERQEHKTNTEIKKNSSKEAVMGSDELKTILQQLDVIQSNISELYKKSAEKNGSDLSALATLQSVEDLKNGAQGLNAIYNLIEQIKNLVYGLKISGFSGSQLEKILANIAAAKSQITTAKSQIAAAGSQITTIESNIIDEIAQTKDDIENKLDKIGSKLQDIKNSLPTNSENSKCDFQFESEHKTFITWTAIFIFTMLISAIFITRGYLVDFSNVALLTATLAIFCISVVILCVFHLIFSIGDVSIYTADTGRRVYYIVCGTVVALTFALALSVLLI